MPQRAAHACAEILDEIDWAIGEASGRSYEDFVADRTFRHAIERSLEIVSEASRRIPEDAKALHPEIPWRAVAGVGNILRHEYHATAPRIVWNVVTGDLPSLRKAVAAIAAHFPITTD
jgi:uncharacterized protein with HEPN domain